PHSGTSLSPRPQPLLHHPPAPLSHPYPSLSFIPHLPLSPDHSLYHFPHLTLTRPQPLLHPPPMPLTPTSPPPSITRPQPLPLPPPHSHPDPSLSFIPYQCLSNTIYPSFYQSHLSLCFPVLPRPVPNNTAA
ncbi:hypothetical protein Pcinc_031138, partial [Petrolisthes cinctipes]